ncbi:MAG: hypothetical protein QXW98_04050 [Candidatus Caldarchaeum sp.]
MASMAAVIKSLQFDIGSGQRGRVYVNDVVFVLADVDGKIAYVVRHSRNLKLWNQVSSLAKINVGLDGLCRMFYDFSLAFIKLVSGMKKTSLIDSVWYNALLNVSNKVPSILGVWYHRVSGVPELSIICVPYANINYRKMFDVSFDDDIQPALVSFYELMLLDGELTNHVEMLHKTFLVPIGLCIERAFASGGIIYDSENISETLYGFKGTY